MQANHPFNSDRASIFVGQPITKFSLDIVLFWINQVTDVDKSGGYRGQMFNPGLDLFFLVILLPFIIILVINSSFSCPLIPLKSFVNSMSISMFLDT